MVDASLILVCLFGYLHCCRKDCEVLASQLQSGGITAAHYHADMEPAARQASHSNWSSGDVQVGGLQLSLHMQ